ncbi:MAG: CPBP family glutamic-type intramembrane protease [Candidatus Hodarchaeales archaeon]
MRKLKQVRKRLRKLEIVEIEDSYLNFFTPAIVVVIGYFLFNLIFWPFLIVDGFILENEVTISAFLNRIIPDLPVLTISSILEIIILLLFSVLLYYIFVIRLKVRSSEYRKVSISSFGYTLLIFLVMILFSLIFRYFYDYFRILLELKPPFAEKPRVHPIFFILSLVATIFEMALYTEIIYRRALIPLFEDRGLSPLVAVILSAWAVFSINIPTYIIIPIFRPGELFLIDIMYDFFYILTFGVCAGLIYILTRNLIFPFLFVALIQIYDYLGPFAPFEVHKILATMISILEIISIVVIICLTIYIFYILINKETTKDWAILIKERSASHTIKGILGFFIITFSLLMIQTITVHTGHLLTDNIPIYISPDGWGIYLDYFCFIMVFYAIAFSIPFWLTIKTEYAQDFPS